MCRASVVVVFLLYVSGLLIGQTGYHVTHYTSKQGLPQNSVRGLAFDQHGFLWIATEGGIARFDGQRFNILGEGDHSGLRNQRFTLALPCLDSSILFVDLLNGMYHLSHDRFITIQVPDANYPGLVRVLGSLPHPQFLIRDSLFLVEARRAQATGQPNIFILPIDTGKTIVVSDRIVMLDLVKSKRYVIGQKDYRMQPFARLENAILSLDANGQLMRLNTSETAFEPCVLKTVNGKDWKGSLKGAMLYGQFPFTEVFVNDGQQVYMLSPGENRLQFIIQAVLDLLPENCNINAIAFRKSENVLVLGTDSRGAFVYHPKSMNTLMQEGLNTQRNNAYYAQCLLDSTTLLAGNGLIIDLTTQKPKGTFARSFNDILLANDDQGNVYYARGNNIFRYDPESGKEELIPPAAKFAAHSIAWIDNAIWIGTTSGVCEIKKDSIHLVFESNSRSNQYGIKSICRDDEGNLWFGSFFQLYRMDRVTGKVDSFPELANADIRVIALVRDRLFIGTYGKGYFIFYNGRFVHMPEGRNHELSNAHTFVEDKEGYLWISTNRGLYKTHFDAVEGFLKDTTLPLDYYAYQEEDGIHNPEFNGGCSPPHLWLPDGRLSFPTLEGLVTFIPERTPHYFPKDTIVIQYIEVDGHLYRQEELHNIPANHSNITIHFAGAWWNKPFNQYIYSHMDEPDAIPRLCDLDQTTISIGHLRPGKHTFILNRRSGFGAEDFVRSRCHFTVEKPWYARGWAILSFTIVFMLLSWGISILNSRSIRKRNISLRQKVAEQTRELLESNVQLEENINKLALSEINLRKNIRVRDRLISIITHDILTPLRFIGQIARLGTEEKPADDGLTKRALKDVQNAVHKLFHSTQNLLHWVTFHQEQFKTSTTNCSPFALVEQLMEDFSEMSRFQGNVLINEVPEDDVILTDPRILTIVLHNLLSNAIKYTKDGQIRVHSGIEHNWYLLEVSDTGRGMTATQLEAVRMGTSKHGEISVEDVTAGNGIGLSLVADLVQALNGHWEIDSPETIGVSVRIFLSLYPRSQV